MMPPTYIVRLDDACPTMAHEKWRSVERLLDRHGIKPIVAVVPDNRDPSLQVQPVDPRFWDLARRWHRKGWAVAVHGCTHVYCTRQGGLVPINRQSEFAGLPLESQRAKLRKAVQVFTEMELPPAIWVAPSHSFDGNTIEALRRETPIRVISDGIAYAPFVADGFTWIPQQLWAPVEKRSGVWTICLHPNTISTEMIAGLEQHLSCWAHRYCSDITGLVGMYAERSRSLRDRLFTIAFFQRLRVRSWVAEMRRKRTA